MYKTTQFSTHAPLHNGGRGVSDIGVTIIWIGADHSKRAILKTEPGDSEPGWGSSPQWSGPPLSPPRPWTNTKDHYNSTSAMLGKKLSPGIWGDRFNGLLPAWEAPVVQVVLYRTWKWTISFESTWRVVEEKELEYNSCYKTTVSKISITLWGNLFLPIFTLWEVLFPPLLSARSSTGEVGAAPILLEWNQVLYVSFYFFDDFQCKI